MDTQSRRIAKQHAGDVARCRARYKEETAERSAFMASDAARFILQRSWKRSLLEMVDTFRLNRYRHNHGRKRSRQQVASRNRVKVRQGRSRSAMA